MGKCALPIVINLEPAEHGLTGKFGARAIATKLVLALWYANSTVVTPFHQLKTSHLSATA